MASAPVVFPEPFAPENRLTGPMSNSQLGTLPQLTNTNFLRNIAAPAVCRHRRRSVARRCRRSARRLDGIRADEIHDHRMDSQPGLAAFELFIAVVVDQSQLPQSLEYRAPLGGLVGQAAIQPILHRQRDALQGLGGEAVFIDLRLTRRLVVLCAQHQYEGHLVLGWPYA